MTRPLRLQLSGAFYHIYNRGVDKRTLFLDDRDRKTFLQFLGETVHQYSLQLYAYCLMGNHYHLFLQTTLPNLGEAMKNLQSQYAHYFNFRQKRSGALFQSRYKSPLVQTDAYSLVLARYIHRNPAAAGMVQKPEEYRWSSYPCYLGILPVWPWLNTQWLLDQFHSEKDLAVQTFRIFHNMVPPLEEIKRIEKFKRVLGDADFYSTLALKAPKGSDPKRPIRV